MLRPVQLDESLIGQPLPWDLYTESGVLVAGAGLTIGDRAHFEKLNARPLFLQSQQEPHSSHPLERLNALAEVCEAILPDPEPGVLREALPRVIDDLLAVFDTDPDACLGYPRLARLARPSIQHGLRVLFVATLLARELEFDDAGLRALAGAALTMNLSALDVHDRLLDPDNPVPHGPRDLPRAHPADSVALLRLHDIDDPLWLETVACHHENLDGSGFPEGRSGAGIGVAARILRVADHYCARTGLHRYRPPKSPALAYRELFGRERHHLDSQLAILLLRRIGAYPPGTLVRLANQEYACIARRGRGGRARLAVSFMDGRKTLMEPPRERNLELRANQPRAFLEPDPAWPRIDWQTLWGY